MRFFKPTPSKVILFILMTVLVLFSIQVEPACSSSSGRLIIPCGEGPHASPLAGYVLSFFDIGPWYPLVGATLFYFWRVSPFIIAHSFLPLALFLTPVIAYVCSCCLIYLLWKVKK